MGLKSALLCGLLDLCDTPVENRNCIFDEIRTGTGEEVLVIITECEGPFRLPLQGEIPGEYCYITPNFNMRCENPPYYMDEL